MTTEQQKALDSLYALDNVLTVKITMPQSDWDAVRTEQPGRWHLQLRLHRGQSVHLA